MSDDHPCSGCPILDLGHVYPVGDPRDPWRRMPRLFAAAEKLVGKSMRNHNGRTRLRVEKLVGHYCRVNRERHGACTRRRSVLCQAIVQSAIEHGARAPQGQKHAYLTQALKNAVNDESVYAQLRATRVEAPDVIAELHLPPILFREVPA